MSTPLNMHAARMALNRDPDLRQWAEQWLKSKERTVAANMTDEEFDKRERKGEVLKVQTVYQYRRQGFLFAIQH
jgi:hypothetical protein